MAKWMFAPLVLVSLGAQANGLAQHGGGCVVLDEIIYEEVTASGWGMTGADLVFTNFREPGVMVCTSASSGRATRAMGNEVTRRPGDSRRNVHVGESGRVDDRSRQIR